jgi:energy-coupling factor transporter transmembrane protein EcfT
MIGAALLVIALLFLFYEWRAAIVSAIAVLLSMLTAGLLLKFYGATINIMVLVFSAASFLRTMPLSMSKGSYAACGRGRRRPEPVGAIVIGRWPKPAHPPLCDADYCLARGPVF